MKKEEYIKRYKDLSYMAYRDDHDDFTAGQVAEAYVVLRNVFGVTDRELVKIEREAWQEYYKDGKPQGV